MNYFTVYEIDLYSRHAEVTILSPPAITIQSEDTQSSYSDIRDALGAFFLPFYTSFVSLNSYGLLL